MQRTCALAAIESTEGTRTRGIASIKKDCSTLWACARPATLLTITKGSAKAL